MSEKKHIPIPAGFTSTRKRSRTISSTSSSSSSEEDSDSREGAESNSAALDFLKTISLGQSPRRARRKKDKDKERDSDRDRERDDGIDRMSTSAPDRTPSFLKKAATAGMRKLSSEDLMAGRSYNQRPTSPIKRTKLRGSNNAWDGDHRIFYGSTIQSKGAVLMDARLMYKQHYDFPFLVSSIIPIDRLKRKAAAQRKADNPNDIYIQEPSSSAQQKAKKGQGVSYADLLLCERESYNPHFLDNEIALPDKYKIKINLSSYRQTIIPYVKASERKKVENEIFQERHTWLKTNITLSKIRSIKRKIMHVAMAKALDIACVGLSYVYFERLILKNVVTANNAKVTGAVCLLLAEKFYGTKSKSFKHLLELMEKHIGVSRKEILSYEFHVFTELSFSLLAEPAEVMPHLVKLQSTQVYLDHLFEHSAEERKRKVLERQQDTDKKRAKSRD